MTIIKPYLVLYYEKVMKDSARKAMFAKRNAMYATHISNAELKLLRKVPKGAKRSDSARIIKLRGIDDPRVKVMWELQQKYNFDQNRASINLSTGELIRNF